jgi:FkbM family methyltransferase
MTIKTMLRKLLGKIIHEKIIAKIKYTRKSFSQFGEDVHIESYYNRLAYDRGIHVNCGVIVDVGAFKPIIYSNTYKFYLKGWSSINIDPTPGSKARFDAARPRDKNHEIAIGPVAGEGTFYLFGNPSVWNTMDAEAARVAASTTGIAPTLINVPIKTLAEVLAENLKDADQFEILSIDAEGYDIEILRSGNFEMYRPRVILIEVHNITIQSIDKTEVFGFLTANGYRLYSWINPNLMFVREDSELGRNA